MSVQAYLSSRAAMQRLDEELGFGVVTSVRVVGPAAPTWKHGRRRIAGPGPRDTYG